MADTLKVYKGGEVVGSAERGVDGIAKVTIDSLTADTDYAAGLYQVAFSNENGESEKVNVPAFKTKPIAVTGVTLDKSTLSLEAGATGNLVATIAPSNASYKAVKFTSSDEAIATVDNDGLVTAVAPGSADITVESLADGSKKAKCTLTVTAKPTTTTTTTAKPTTTTTTTAKPTTTTTTTVAPTTTTTTTVEPTTTTTTTEPTTTTTSTSSTTTSTTTEPTTTTTTTVEPTTTTTTSTKAPTTTTTTTEGTTTTTTTTLDPSNPSDVPEAESEVPNVEL